MQEVLPEYVRRRGRKYHGLIRRRVTLSFNFVEVALRKHLREKVEWMARVELGCQNRVHWIKGEADSVKFIPIIQNENVEFHIHPRRGKCLGGNNFSVRDFLRALGKNLPVIILLNSRGKFLLMRIPVLSRQKFQRACQLVFDYPEKLYWSVLERARREVSFQSRLSKNSVSCRVEFRRILGPVIQRYLCQMYNIIIEEIHPPCEINL